MHGRANLVRLLLRLGADPRAQRPAHGGATAASAAAAHGHADVLAALAEAGADVESRGSEGLSPVDYLLRRAWAALEAVCGDCLGAAVAPHEAARQRLAQLALQAAVPRAPCRAAAALPPAVLTRLIAPDAAHVGAGSFVVDGGFDDAFLQRLLHTFGTLPLAPRVKSSQGLNDRAYLSDAEGGGRRVEHLLLLLLHHHLQHHLLLLLGAPHLATTPRHHPLPPASCLLGQALLWLLGNGTWPLRAWREGRGTGSRIGASCELCAAFPTPGWIAVGLRRAVLAAGGGVRVAGGAWTPCVGDALSFMRFLLYAEAGG